MKSNHVHGCMKTNYKNVKKRLKFLYTIKGCGARGFTSYILLYCSFEKWRLQLRNIYPFVQHLITELGQPPAMSTCLLGYHIRNVLSKAVGAILDSEWSEKCIDFTMILCLIKNGYVFSSNHYLCYLSLRREVRHNFRILCIMLHYNIQTISLWLPSIRVNNKTKLLYTIKNNFEQRRIRFLGVGVLHGYGQCDHLLYGRVLSDQFLRGYGLYGHLLRGSCDLRGCGQYDLHHHPLDDFLYLRDDSGHQNIVVTQKFNLVSSIKEWGSKCPVMIATYLFTNKINLFNANLKQLKFFENIDLSRTKIDRMSLLFLYKNPLFCTVLL
ncbi:hypothetical protein AGLY_000877 [Aphis glycines]|uniref:Uncharacterized protein n=1 Tax=Aphis glycines TaxID=307491 RepID=A0A6G0U8D3_APHGL|nr:hypothetical protein AGLY_000877 [Aphis glycines]